MDDIKDFLERLDKINVASLKREGKDYDFIDVYPVLLECFNNFKLLKKYPQVWNLLRKDGEARNNLNSFIKSFTEQAEKIRDFNPQRERDPQAIRKSLAANINQYYDEFQKLLFPSIKLAKLEDDVKGGRIESLFEESKKALSGIEEVKSEARKILASLKEVSAISGLEKYAEVFHQQSRKHFWAGIAWLVFSLLGAGLATLGLWEIYNELLLTLSKAPDAPTISIILVKMLIFSFVSGVIYQLFKNYNAHMHLYATNRHRANCLKTFQVFFHAGVDPKIKDAILIQATRSIFDPGTSGFINQKDTALNVLETIKVTDQLRNK